VGSLSSTTATNLYRVQTPNIQNGQKLVLTVTARVLGVNGTVPRITILDTDMKPVASQILANGDGTFAIQTTGLKPKGNFYIEATSQGATGNFALAAQFGNAAASLSTFATGSLASSTDQQSYNFYVGETQLMQFVLSAGAVGAPAGAKVQMTVVNSLGKAIESLIATVGNTVSGGALFVTPGAYTIRFSVLGLGTAKIPPITYTLKGEGVSDPIGPVIKDPTLTPVFTSPTLPGIFTYPNGTTTTSPFLIVPAPKK
jgi:hypothetical protein